MTPPIAAPSGRTVPQSSIQSAEEEAQASRWESRNLAALALHLILFRVGWIFKIESVLMPAFLDFLAGPGWMRGMLPVLNRLGQSVAPLWAADWVRGSPCKIRVLMHGTWLRGLVAFVLAGCYLLSGRERPTWMAGVFLLLYTLFFVCHGVSQLSFNMLQGKVLRPVRFGRLMALSDPAGTVLATVFAAVLLPLWLARQGGFAAIFLCTGTSFALSLLPLLGIRESPDASTQNSGIARSPWRPLRDAASVWRADGNFRRLATVAMLFSTMQILVPHYQAFGRERLGLQLTDLMPCVVAQNLATGLFSLLAGPAADRWGSRLVMRWLNLAAALAPFWALVLAAAMSGRAGRLYFFSVFVPVGLMPVCFKTFNNYILEATQPERHACYLSTLSVFIGAPFLLAPLVGWATQLAGFESVFLWGAGLIALSALLAGGLREPRQGEPPARRADAPPPTR